MRGIPSISEARRAKLRNGYTGLEKVSASANTISSGAKAIFNTMIAGVGLILAVELGPIDAPRTLKAMTLGETHLLRAELAQYCRVGIAHRYASRNELALDAQVEQTLAAYLRAPIVNGTTNIDGVRIERLWDCTEAYAKNWQDKYFIPNLKGY